MSLGEVLGVTPTDGAETDWLPLASLALPDGRLALADPMFMYQAEGLLLPAGTYLISVKLRGHRGHRIVSGLRVASEPGGVVGAAVALVVVDSAQVGVGDLALIAPVIERLDPDAYEAMLSETNTDDPVGLFHWDDRTPMYFVGSGFGDGRYVVREVVSGSGRVGVEIAFAEESDA